ncbi:LOW QUALITY PROTEIN: hypothetical protein U9M48_003184 [Paspalum notatum var. saurae]|uniref:Uncharacterized protein n=1 Tax=Paspalum notatum var. saurae TaxID=547442 RepID=A0AAQ3PIQ7_PASNO
MLPYNIDLMHQERNVAESIISMCFDTDKTKDNVKARKDLAEICDRPWLEIQINSNGKESRPRAPYSERLETDIEVFPDRYATNIKRTVNVSTGKLNGLKSHDYHILMERILPIMFHGYFDDELWKLIAELSYFYRQLCAKVISKKLMRKLEKGIPVLL